MTAAELIKPADGVLLVVWMTAAMRVGRAGSFIVAVADEGEIDEQEAAAAQQLAGEVRTLGESIGSRSPARW